MQSWYGEDRSALCVAGGLVWRRWVRCSKQVFYRKDFGALSVYFGKVEGLRHCNSRVLRRTTGDGKRLGTVFGYVLSSVRATAKDKSDGCGAEEGDDYDTDDG